MCTRIVDLLPKRVCITHLLPAGSCPPLLRLSHRDIRGQLVSHAGIALARVLEEQRLAAACTCSVVTLQDLVQQVIHTCMRAGGPRAWGLTDRAAAGCTLLPPPAPPPRHLRVG